MKQKILEILNDSVNSLLKDSDEKIVLQLSVPKDKSHGDFASNAAMILCKKLGRNPRELATELAAALNQKLQNIATCELAGPGFLNFKLSADAGVSIFESLIQKGEKIGCLNIGNGKNVNIEYVSANPTGPLTVGHGRNAAVGDIIANILSTVGYDVTREYYFNDAGNQMTVLANSVKTRYLQLLGEKVELDENGYQGDYIIDIAKKVFEDYGDSLKLETKIDKFKEYAVDATFKMIKDTLLRMGVKHDIYFNERTLYDSGKIEETLADIKEKNLSYEKDGAVWFKAQQFGAEKDRVLVKSSGEPTYRLPDIAYHRDKFSRKYDLMIDVFGADHLATYPDVMACLKELDYDTDKIKVLTHQFVTVVRDGIVVKMSTRKANYVTLDELMDDVGVDATRYFFVMRRLGSHFEFDLELAKKQSLDNPIFYVQYAHARISSIFRHASEQKPHIDISSLNNIDAALLDKEEEKDIINHLDRFEEMLSVTAKCFEPHRLTAYLEKMAELFHRYYNLHKVVVESDETTKARLMLVMITQRVIKKGLEILGIEAPNKM